MTLRISKMQRSLFTLLCEADAAGRKLTRDEILRTTGYAQTSFDTNLGKGLYSRFLIEHRPGEFEVAGTKGLTVEDFVQLTTQSLYVRELGYHCRSRLAKALLRKSRDNMVLALELYNRPSLDNRLDAFALLFCAAWEQLLKARLIERDGEESIFKQTHPNRPQETISLLAALERLFTSHDLTRRNLERIKYLRDQATHLTMPEVQGAASRLFQSGVLNYAREFRAFARQPFVPGSPVGLLTLVVETKSPQVVHLKGIYGAKVGAEVLQLVRTLEEEITSTNDPAFAVPLDYSLVFSKTSTQADMSLAIATGAARTAVVVEKPRDVEKTHPLTSQDVEREVLRKLTDRVGKTKLASYLPSRKDGEPAFNSYDLQAVIHKEGWKRSNNREHHLLTKRPELHRYSHHMVDTLVERIVGTPGYIAGARGSLSHHRKKKY